MSTTSVTSRQILLTIGKASISLAAIAIIVPKIKLGLLSEHLSQLSTLAIATALLILITETCVVAGLRLQLVLRGLGVNRTRVETSQVALSGIFFEQVAFGFLGGDGMRIWLLHRLGVAPRLSVQAIMIDRCLGLFALLLLALIGLPNLMHLLTGIHPGLLVGGGTLVLALGGAALVALRHRIGRLSGYKVLAELLASTSVVWRDPNRRRCFMLTLALAAATHTLNVLVFFTLGHSLGLAVTGEQWFFVVPSSLLLAMLPVSAGGWGMREACFIVALGSIGIPPEQAIVPSVLFGLCILLVALPGGLIWLMQRRQSITAQRRVEGSVHQSTVADSTLVPAATTQNVSSAKAS